MDAEIRKARKLARKAGMVAEHARNFPINTCPASRHVHMIADALAAGEKYHQLDEEPEHCAESLYSVIGSLWEARTELAALRASPPDSIEDER